MPWTLIGRALSKALQEMVANGIPEVEPQRTSRMVYLRKRFSDQEISKEGTELLLASWRQKSAKSYNSLLQQVGLLV